MYFGLPFDSNVSAGGSDSVATFVFFVPFIVLNNTKEGDCVQWPLLSVLFELPKGGWWVGGV